MCFDVFVVNIWICRVSIGSGKKNVCELSLEVIPCTSISHDKCVLCYTENKYAC